MIETFAPRSRDESGNYRPQFQSDPERVKRIQQEVQNGRVRKTLKRQNACHICGGRHPFHPQIEIANAKPSSNPAATRSALLATYIANQIDPESKRILEQRWHAKPPVY